MNEAQPIPIDLDLLDDHPDNPRLFFREDVVNGIAAQLEEKGFDPANALLVRPLNGRYQIVRGHQRKAAAIKAGLKKVPCWPREMTDDEAYMELALGNVQGELSPLEIGIHALSLIKGNRIGANQKKYAAQLGKSEPYITQLRKAAEVFINIIDLSQLNIIMLSSKAQHLAIIHQLDSLLWLLLSEAMLEREWSTEETQKEVKKVKGFLDTVPSWWNVDKEALTLLALDGKHKSIEAMFSYVREVEQELKPIILHILKQTDETEERDGREFRKWVTQKREVDPASILRDRLTTLSSLPSKEEVGEMQADILAYIQEHSTPTEKWIPILTGEEWETELRRKEELARIAKRKLYMPRLMCCDVMEGLRRILTESIDLICIDPPYNIGKADWDEFDSPKEYVKWARGWLRECYRVLKPSGSLYLFGRFAILRYVSIVAENIGFVLQKDIEWDTIQGSGGPGLWPIRHETILYFTKGADFYENLEAVQLERHEEHVREYKGKEYEFKNVSTVWRFPCVDANHPDRTDHPTQKPVELIERIIKASCPPDGKVLDCFIGSGTTGVAAMKQERRSIGIDNNPDYIAIARARFDSTEIGISDG